MYEQVYQAANGHEAAARKKEACTRFLQEIDDGFDQQAMYQYLDDAFRGKSAPRQTLKASKPLKTKSFKLTEQAKPSPDKVIRRPSFLQEPLKKQEIPEPEPPSYPLTAH
jgi:hypothetical protein